MQRKHISKLFYSVALSIFLSATPAFATGFPTLDLAEVFNTIQSSISQAQSQISTIQETLSISNIQQAIGDKLGGLSKIKDLKAKAEKIKEKAEKAKARAEKVIELKKKYEQEVQNAISQVQDKYNQAISTVNDVKNQVEGVKNQVEGAVNDVKNQVEGVKNQVEGAVNNVKNQVEGVKNQVEGAVNDVKNQVEGVKNQVEGAVNDVKNQVDNAKNTANDLYGNLQSGFKKEGSAGSANNGSVVSGTNEVVPWQFGEGEDFFADTQSGNDGNFVSTSVYNSDIQKKEPENKAVEPVSSKMIEGLWAEDNEVELSAGPVEKTAIEAKTDGPLLLKDEKPVADRVVVPQKELDMDGLKNPINLDLKKSDDLPNLKNIERSEDLKPISAEKNVITPTKFVKPATTPTLTPAAQNLKDKAVSVSAPVSTKPEALSTAPTPAPAPTLSTAVKPALQKTTPSSATITRKAFEKVSYVDVYQHGFAAEAKFATGTDGEANYYFPDTFALWTGINFDDKVDEEKMEKAVSTICSDLNSTDDTTKAAYVNQYNKLLAEAKAHAQAYSAATVKETESTKTTDDLESMNGKLGSMLDQMSGSGEILTAEVEQNKRELVMIADNIQLEVFGELLHYCDIYQVGEKDYANGEKFAVGVDDNGVFHYPERMARWCSLDVKDEKNKDVLEGCLSKICSDMNASNETDANDAKMYYENMMKEVWVNAFILTVEIKQKYANTKLEDKASDITEKAAGERTTQTTGNSEIDKFLKRMKYDAERLREVVFELQAYRVVSDFCDVFIQKEQGEKE